MDTPERGFSKAEFEQRTERLQSAMIDSGIDVVLLTTHADIFYFTGFLTQFWQSPTRPWFLAIPKNAKPVAVIPGIGLECMQRTWIDDIRTWASPHPTDDGVSLLTSTLIEIGGPLLQLGMPMGGETHLRMPLLTVHAIQHSIPPARWWDATMLIRNVRAVKSEHEIEKIRFCCTAASNAFDEITSYDLKGLSEIDLFKKFKMGCLAQGVDDSAYLVGSAGPDGYGDVISPPGNRLLQDGDVFMLDTGCVWDGYYCDFDRNYAIGGASKEANDVYNLLWNATEAAIDSIKPGMSCRQVYDIMMKELPGDSGGNVGRIGHGLGIDLTEPPSLTAFDETELKEGMVMTLEPGYNYGNGLTMVHEENLVIRASGVEMLSKRADKTMPICKNI